MPGLRLVESSNSILLPGIVRGALRPFMERSPLSELVLQSSLARNRCVRASRRHDQKTIGHFYGVVAKIIVVLPCGRREDRDVDPGLVGSTCWVEVLGHACPQWPCLQPDALRRVGRPPWNRGGLFFFYCLGLTKWPTRNVFSHSVQRSLKTHV